MNFENEEFTKIWLNKLLLSDNLGIFDQEVQKLCKLQANGQISLSEAYKEIDDLWKKLKYSAKKLGVEQNDNK